MTRQAVESKFGEFVDEAITITAQEFSVARALRQGARGPGGSVIDRLLKNSDTLWQRVVQPELDSYRDQTLEQFSILMEYVESGDSIEAYRERLLAADGFANAMKESLPESRRKEVEDILMRRLEGLAEAARPVVEAAEEEFWPAVRATLTREQARSLIEDHFAFTWPVREHRSAFEMQTSFEPKEILGGIGSLLGGGLPTVTVAYTDEAIRAMHRAERKVIATAHDEIERRFD